MLPKPFRDIIRVFLKLIANVYVNKRNTMKRYTLRMLYTMISPDLPQSLFISHCHTGATHYANVMGEVSVWSRWPSNEPRYLPHYVYIMFTGIFSNSFNTKKHPPIQYDVSKRFGYHSQDPTQLIYNYNI